MSELSESSEFLAVWACGRSVWQIAVHGRAPRRVGTGERISGSSQISIQISIQISPIVRGEGFFYG